ncbi:eEF1A lysine and N-terminal methyltransferase [Rhipicephalus sanguineus]|uniref:eEF1A lysine and N-terminal methyltransferase n=1 Tax=Rhipicephalus sanguineus TaxID=34632 RepID=UPI00189516F6|nr:eEF1A lysine and N-terminal methyltransferase [Rhipicephalus sanguineus]
MNLLPKASSEFASEKYWNEFFHKRGKAAFEWYGEFWQHAETIFKYLKESTDKILIVGCGNSTLSADLYDSGYRNITSIDISDVAIRQMNDKYVTSRPQMQFLQMDATQMNFKDEEFSVILDKGTVDALTPDSDSAAKLYAVLKEVSRVLRVGGRFLCISLLQTHILQALLKWFSSDPAWTWVIRFHRCEDAEAQEEGASRLVLPVFVVVFTKLKRLLGLETVTELAFDPQSKPRRVPASTVCNEVASMQQYAFIRHRIAKRNLEKGDDVSLDLYASWSDIPRYRLFVCDLQAKIQTQLKFAIFIVPQGRESEWLFSTAEGRQQLTETCRADRVIVVHLCREQNYLGLDQVKKELSSKVMELAPASYMEGKQVPFMTTGDDVGHRQIRHQGCSALSGQYVIEDVSLPKGIVVRRLIFLDKPHVIQTEARLKSVKLKGQKGKVWEVVKDDLRSEYYKYMVAGLAFIMPKGTEEPASALMVGLGGGTLPLFLATKFPKLQLSVVELDPEVVDVARKWYLPQDCPMEICVEDGLKAFERLSKEGKTFDLVFLDVDNKDLSEGLTCPPAEFLAEKTLKELAAITKCTGAVVINFVCRNEALKKEMYQRLKKVFCAVYFQSIPDNVNEVLYLSNSECDTTMKTFISNVEQLRSTMDTTSNGNIADLMEGLNLV